VLQRWNECFSEISNEEFSHPPIQTADLTLGPVPEIATTEVETAMKKVQNGKANGPDDIPTDVWKILGRKETEILTCLFNKIVDEDTALSTWTISVTVPIWKGKDDVMECSNYRPIRLLCHTMKIFQRVLDARIRNIVNITTNECDFVKRCETTDAIHAARLLLEKHRERNKPLHISFLDLETVFDRIPHELIWYTMRSHGVPET
jgi:hypothetical protein